MRHLPVLDSIRIASPCHEAWDRMVGSELVRSCASCKLNVFNLSAMTRAQATELLASHTGRMCARYYRRADGTILTADCPVGARRRRRQWIAIAALGGAASLAAVADIARHFDAPAAEAPRAQIEMIEPVATMAERLVQPEPQRVLRARPEMITGDIGPDAPIAEHEHWTVGVMAMPARYDDLLDDENKR